MQEVSLHGAIDRILTRLNPLSNARMIEDRLRLFLNAYKDAGLDRQVGLGVTVHISLWLFRFTMHLVDFHLFLFIIGSLSNSCLLLLLSYTPVHSI